MNSKSSLSAIMSNLRSKAKANVGSVFTFDQATSEIAQALKIKYEAAAMTLYGLCATGNVRWLNEQGTVAEEDKCTIAEFYGQKTPAFVVADDVRHWLTQWSPDPLPDQRWDVIRKMLAEDNPPRTISWKEFCDRVRYECNGWIKTGGELKPRPGFSQKQIQRIVKDLRAK